MPRIVMKGGVWKNSEDEILKAAIMKYGLNQWSRVASLLPRKTAASCKSRWYEWLDPGIKKTEWTREEEERLLHLAKLMPSQWRTIAPLVGRTAAQCIEHYERLLDAAQAGESGAGAGSSRRDDPRRLRPGEIDPMPEVKPARPDPVDMDEDEKEMLSEARARLANTKGKKAKRKVRERMLDEARRLASLQKARELKAAGIELKKRKRKANAGIDYAHEIPFEKKAPAGFYDVGGEDARYITDKANETAEFKTTLLNKIEDERMADTEARERQRDKRKMKKLTAADLPAVLLAEAERDPLNVRKRAKLSLPPPSMTEAELEDVARIGAAAGSAGYLLDDDGMDGGGSVATRGLLGDYSGEGGVAGDGSVVSLAPRRGGAGATRESILEEARNQAAMRHETTVLAGGDNVALEAGTGFDGATPAGRRIQAPNTGMSTALRAGLGAGAGGATPFTGGGGLGLPAPQSSGASVIGGASAVTGRTGATNGAGKRPLVMRDAMGLNKGSGEYDDEGDRESFLGDSASAFGDGGASTAFNGFGRRGAGAGAQVALGLRSLPKPRNEYDVVAPSLDDDADMEMMMGGGSGDGVAGSSAEVEDASEAEARELQRQEAERQAELARRSAALRHEPALPRPLVIDDDAIAPPLGASARGDVMAVAGGMISDEVVAMVKADAVKYPVAHKFFKPPRRAAALADLSDDQLAAARALIEAEVTNVRIEAENAIGAEINADSYSEAWDRVAADHVYLPSSHGYVSASQATSSSSSSPAQREEYLSALKQRWEALHTAWSREQARLGKVEEKLRVLTKGFEMRTAALTKQMEQSASEATDKAIELACFVRLAHDEASALPARIAVASVLAQEEQDREKQLQQRYADLMREMDQLREALAKRV